MKGKTMHFRMGSLSQLGLLLFALVVALLCQPVTTAAQTAGFVYVQTDQPTGNAVIQYSRDSNGALTEVSEVSTGGLGGTGNGVGALDPLGSQDSLVLDGTGSLLLVVNAGSNELSSIRAGSAGLHLLSKASSGGSFPNSVALNGNLVYVLNAHGTPNISGFRLDSAGTLQPIANSTFNLPGGTSAAPHDIRFSPDGTRLLVAEGGTNQIDIFALDDNGAPTGVVTQPSAGSGVFSLRFGRAGVLASAEAASNSVSTYFLTPEDTLSVVSGAVEDTQAATCWISLTGNGKFAFTSNTGSGTLSAYQIAGNGTLNLESAVAASLGNGHPIDSTLSSDSAFLYVVDSAAGRVVSFRVQGASLIPIGSVTGLPTTSQGIAAQ